VLGIFYLKIVYVRLGANVTLGLEKEQELQELFKRMDTLLIKGCDVHINRNKFKVIKRRIWSHQWLKKLIKVL